MTSKRRRTGTLIWLIVVLATLEFTSLLLHREDESDASFVVFSPQKGGCLLAIPADATQEEQTAAELLRRTLAKSAGWGESEFPIVSERRARRRRALFVGATRHPLSPTTPRAFPDNNRVSLDVRDGGAWLRSERRETIVAAASWFLEAQLGAHWFMPGPLGEHVSRRTELSLPRGEQHAEPAFISRDIATGGTAEGRAWYAANRLESRFEHGHNLVNIFKPEDFVRQPEMAPIRKGVRYFPPGGGNYNWQPNLLSPAAVEHAANAAIRAFEADSNRATFSLSINDTTRYDESPETLRFVTPPRYFRSRPDYSNLVFTFANGVAERVAQRYPNRYLPAYAYYWCENTPDFPIAPNVVPFLTADRSQWCYPEFAAEDRALIERWCRSGAKIVGAYDYFEGSPFLVPRPTLWVSTETIPFEYRAGVRAFFAEGFSNWALDGPKPWLAAQLLWSPDKNPDELLATYFREFWGESATPMREYFALCDQAWREQPGPPQWLRLYEEEDHFLVFSAERLTRLRQCINEAVKLAHTDLVRARAAFVSEGFSVTEAFCEFCAARQRLARLVRPGAAPAEIIAAWKQYREARAKHIESLSRIQREHPLAIGVSSQLDLYLRNQPDSRAARELLRTGEGRRLLVQAPQLTRDYLGVAPSEVDRVLNDGVPCLSDPNWEALVVTSATRSIDNEWGASPGKTWFGRGEPHESRDIKLVQRQDGRRILRISGTPGDILGQWQTAVPNDIYAAQVSVRTKVGPGTAVYLVLSFLDETSNHIGVGVVDRVPEGEGIQEFDLCVISRAPPNARSVGFGLRVLNQLDGEFAEFSAPALQHASPSPK